MNDCHELAGDDPFELFSAWLEDARKSELNDANAAALATSTIDGRPSVRMVLVKQVNELGFSFFTNVESQKGQELARNPNAALCFHWKSLRRQVRVEGTTTALDDTTVDSYFSSRSRQSQIGAAVSQQSRPLPDRATLEDDIKRFTASHPGDVPRPSFWRGFRIQPERIEFWMDGADRLHDRFLFAREGSDWRKSRLYP